MDFNLSENQQLIAETVRKFAEVNIRPSLMEWDESQHFPVELFHQLGELGLMGVLVPEEYGGGGMDAISYVLAMEEISKVDASASVCMSVNNSLVCWGLEEYGTEEQKKIGRAHV